MFVVRVLSAFAIGAITLLLPIGDSVAQQPASLSGEWQGKLNVVANSYAPPANNLQNELIKIGINHEIVKVFLNNKEVHPGTFKIMQDKTNAVIVSITSGKDKEGQWVETWVFSITQKDINSLIVNYSHIVNNTNLPLESDHSKFFALATGEFHRL